MRNFFFTTCHTKFWKFYVFILGGMFHYAAVHLWYLNTDSFLLSIGQTPRQVSVSWAWVPILSQGMVLLPVSILFCAKREIIRRSSNICRVSMIALSQLLATPFVFLSLNSEPPATYAYIFFSYWLGEKREDRQTKR